MPTLSDAQFTWAIVAVIAIICMTGVLLFWVSRKNPVRKQKPDAIFKAFQVWILLLLGYAIIALFGWRTQDQAKSDVKWLIVALIVLIIFYGLVSHFVNRPIPSHKLYTEYVLPEVKKEWHAVPYAGSAYSNGMVLSMVIDMEKNSRARAYLDGRGESGVVPQKVEVFYGEVRFANMFHFLAVHNKMTGERIMLVRPPILNMALIQKFLGEEITSSFAPALNQYDSQVEGTQPPQKETKVET